MAGSWSKLLPPRSLPWGPLLHFELPLTALSPLKSISGPQTCAFHTPPPPAYSRHPINTWGVFSCQTLEVGLHEGCSQEGNHEGPFRKQWVVRISSLWGSLWLGTAHVPGRFTPRSPLPPSGLLYLLGTLLGGLMGPTPFLRLSCPQQSLPRTPGSVAGGVPFREQTALKEETPGVGTVQPEREA